jgi:hypothetical protein
LTMLIIGPARFRDILYIILYISKESHWRKGDFGIRRSLILTCRNYEPDCVKRKWHEYSCYAARRDTEASLADVTRSDLACSLTYASLFKLQELETVDSRSSRFFASTSGSQIQQFLFDRLTAPQFALHPNKAPTFGCRQSSTSRSKIIGDHVSQPRTYSRRDSG